MERERGRREVTELRQKLKATDKEMHQERQRVRLQGERERGDRERELNITELRQKLKAMDKEMHQERQRVRL